ncbi:MAG TPA: TrkH family potassium uptake protein [Candidatus Brocadiia bacterium]|nr:TrkH family potassium uptake protein [Candidatus Brocadiia bacterium]
MRETAYMRLRYRAVLSQTGFVMVICAGLILTPLMALPFWPEEIAQAHAFLIPAVVMALLGIIFWRLFKPADEIALTVQEGGIIVLLVWIIACLFSAWPLMSGHGLNFTQAVFESVSGWSTTGLSVVDVTRASHMVLLWRSMMQLAGGAGLAIIMLAAVIGPTGPAVSTAEGRDLLVPHVRKSARLVLIIYGGYIVAGIPALRLVGMSWFDAANHAITAVSTGGFSTRVESIGYWDSPAVESVTIVLMILGNLNFVTAWVLLRGRFRAFIRNGEVRLMAVLIPVSAILLLGLTCRGLYPSLSKSARVALFENVSALTTTGFSTVGYGNWNAFGWFVLIVLMLVGGGACSTAGGIKQFRIYLLWKGVIWEIRRWLMPSSAVMENAIWEGDQLVFVSDARLRQVGVFFFLYLFTYMLGVGTLCAYGVGLKDALFEFASSIGDVGLSVGVTNASAPPGLLWAETIGMFLGRLEIIVVFAAAVKLLRDLPTLVGRAD